MDETRTTDGSLALKQKKVIVINAAERPEAQKLRVAAYARVSSDSSDQLNSFAAQLNYYNTLIAGNETWEMVDLYADRGITGTSAEKRPDFQRMLADCRKGRVDKILVKSISRFARNTKECLEIVRDLKGIGVGVCFEEQNIDTAKMSGELLTAVFAAIAQKESESISENMRWSYKHRMESGTFLPPSMAFGYRIEDRKIVIDEDKAAVVRRIFREYLDGYGMSEITRRLNVDGVPSFEKERWTINAVSYILSNERYIGDSLWQKKYATDTLPVKIVRNHGERKQYYAMGTQEPIIDRAVYQAVQELRKARSERFYKANHEQRAPLQAKIICANCGAIFTKHFCRETAYWCCRSHFTNKEKCPVRQIPESEIHAGFLRLYHKLKHEGEPILTQLVSDLRAVRNSRMLWSADIVALNKRISDIADQNQLLASMNRLGLVDPDIFIAHSNEYEQQLRAAKQERARLLDAEGDDAVAATEELIDTLDSMPEFLTAFDGGIFDELVDHVVAGEDAEMKFHLKNGLALTEQIERMAR